MRVYREKKKRRDGPFKVTIVADKIISVTDEHKLKQFNIRAVLPMEAKANDSDLTHDMNKIDRYYFTDKDELQLPSEIILK